MDGVSDPAVHLACRGVPRALFDVEVMTVDSEAVDGRPDVDGPDHDRVAGVGPQQRGPWIAPLVGAESQ